MAGRCDEFIESRAANAVSRAGTDKLTNRTPRPAVRAVRWTDASRETWSRTASTSAPSMCTAPPSATSTLTCCLCLPCPWLPVVRHEAFACAPCQCQCRIMTVSLWWCGCERC
eukprot:483952-Rhodomonas_salina.4